MLVGLDEDVLAAIDASASTTRRWLDCLLVVRHGDVVWERYYNGYDADTPHQLRSATKSVLSALVGIALDLGILQSLDQTIGELLAARAPADVDPRKLAITIGDCLRMRSGLDWQEDGAEAGLQWLLAPDSLAYTFGPQPVAAPPGTRWQYSTPDSQLVGACLTAASGCSLSAFADEHLFGPIGAGLQRWDTSIWPGRWPNEDLNMGGSELYLRPRDLARFGELHLRKGEWDGRTIVSKEWVQTSTARQPDVDAAVIGATSEGLRAASRWFDGYGLHWWRATLGGHDAVIAAGQFGQYCVIVEALDLVVVQHASPTVTPALQPFVDDGTVDDWLRLAGEIHPAEVPALWTAFEASRADVFAGQLGGLELLDDLLATVRSEHLG